MKENNIIGDILSRNEKMKPVEFNNEDYNEVVRRKINELDEIARTESEYIQKLRLGNK